MSQPTAVIEVKRPNEVTLAEVKRPQEVVTMNIKDSLKFGVLIGLLEVSARVRNKEIVDAVLHLVSTTYGAYTRVCGSGSAKIGLAAIAGSLANFVLSGSESSAKHRHRTVPTY